MKKLSPTMAAALDVAAAHNGELECWKGGFWTYPGCAVVKQENGATGPYSVPEWHVGTQTIHALKDRGRIEFTEWSRNFPIRAKVIDGEPSL